MRKLAPTALPFPLLLQVRGLVAKNILQYTGDETMKTQLRAAKAPRKLCRLIGDLAVRAGWTGANALCPPSWPTRTAEPLPLHSPLPSQP